MSANVYETRLTRILKQLEDDLSSNRISEKEFEILLGLLIEKEFSDNIKQQMHGILPMRKNNHRRLSWINYEWKHSYAK
jgi:ribosomal protein S3AE